MRRDAAESPASRRLRRLVAHPPIGATIAPATHRRIGGQPVSRETPDLRWHARQNQLLAALPSVDFERLRPALEPIALPLGLIVREAGSHGRYAYFPVTGIVSIEQELANGDTTEVALTGNDGMVGLALILGGATSTSRAFVRAEGMGYRVRADLLLKEFERSRSLRKILLGHAQLLFTQVAQTIACRRRHSVEQQVCRVILSTIERLESDDLALTHELIAELIGTRRESVTLAAGELQMAGVIRYHRGRVKVLDRKALAGRACECHAAIRSEALRLFAQSRAASQRLTVGPRHTLPDFAFAAAARESQFPASIWRRVEYESEERAVVQDRRCR